MGNLSKEDGFLEIRRQLKILKSCLCCKLNSVRGLVFPIWHCKPMSGSRVCPWQPTAVERRTCHPDPLQGTTCCPLHTAFSHWHLQKVLQLCLLLPEVMVFPGQPSFHEWARRGDRGTAILTKCAHRTTPTHIICSKSPQRLPGLSMSSCDSSLYPINIGP